MRCSHTFLPGSSELLLPRVLVTARCPHAGVAAGGDRALQILLLWHPKHSAACRADAQNLSLIRKGVVRVCTYQ